jgi:hypothetical protein
VNQVREAAKQQSSLRRRSDRASQNNGQARALLNARRVKFIEVPSASELGAAVGREQTAVVGILDRQLAAGVQNWYRRPEPGTLRRMFE